MRMQTYDLYIVQVFCSTKSKKSFFEGDAKFIVCKSRRDIRMSFRVYMRIDTNTNVRFFPEFPGNVINDFKFLKTFNIDSEDIGLECKLDLLIGFSGTVKCYF